ncbi:MAG TPA: type II secretion system protein GspC [bacterium]|nr:type II secretion system protein GspC [bacterium]
MLSLRRYDWALHVATIVLCAYFLARAMTTYVAGALESPTASLPPPPAPSASEAPSDEDKEGADAYGLIVDRNIFNSVDVVGPETAPTAEEQLEPGQLGPAVKTALSIKVESTLVIGDGMDRRSSAIVSGGKSKGSQAYFIGDEESFAPNVKMTKVDKDRIEFINGGRLEYAELEDWISKKSVFLPPDEAHGKEAKATDAKEKPASSEASSAGGKIVLDQKEVDDALGNLDKLQKEVNIVPNFQDGKMEGFKVVSIKPGGLISKLGVRRGDVLKNVNGQELDIKRGMELFSTMRDSKNFSLDVVRGGKNQTLEYEIR